MTPWWPWNNAFKSIHLWYTYGKLIWPWMSDPGWPWTIFLLKTDIEYWQHIHQVLCPYTYAKEFGHAYVHSHIWLHHHTPPPGLHRTLTQPQPSQKLPMAETNFGGRTCVVGVVHVVRVLQTPVKGLILVLVPSWQDVFMIILASTTSIQLCKAYQVI